MKPIFYFLIVFSTIAFGQSDVPLTLRKQFNGQFGYTIIGNTLNPFDNWQFPNPPCQMLTTSSAVLNLNANQTVVAAYLYWSGIGDGTFNPTVQLNGINLVASTISIGNASPGPDFACFGSFKDVTSVAQITGNGQYVFSGFDLNPISAPFCSNAEYYAGWTIVVVYSDNTLPNVQLNIYDGLNAANQFFNNGITPLTIGNLNVTNTSNASMSYLAWKGSSNNFSVEYISFNSNTLSNLQNPANNPFNSTNSFTGSNTLWNMDIDTFDISSYINVGNTSANIIFSSDFPRFLQTVVTSIRSELPDATVLQTQVSGQETCNNRNLLVNYTVKNTNSNGNLPANIPVSFYADNVFLSTVNTPTPIAIGGVLPLQTTVAVPLSVSNTFNLRVVVDNNAANLSTIAESNEANNESSQSITLLSGNVIPTFAIQNSFCQGAIAPVLPNLSNNIIAGSWSPSVVDNQNSGSYLFTPNAGVCASNFTLAVNVTPSVTPTFLLQNAFCAGATVPVLPAVSTNNIAGSWSPSVINNQTSASYVFTPTVGTCASKFTLNVVVTNPATPTFGLQTSFCAGAIVPVLSSISSNNVSGTWSPNVIDNQNNGSYLFTPSSSACALPFALNVTITPNITPTFVLQNTFCQGAIVAALPTVSNNAISGTWLPSAIDNQASGTYVFKPTAGICAASFTLNTIVVPQTTSTENRFICENNLSNPNAVVELDSGLNQNDFTFVWTVNNQIINQNTTSISVAAAGNYQLVATSNALGCQQTLNFKVVPFQTFTTDFIIKDDFESDQTIAVEATGGSGQFEYSFENLPFQNYNIYSLANGGDIVVKVRDSNNCYEISKTITVWQYPRFFSPNGDSFNDTWSIKSTKKIAVSIYDRFGRLVKQLQNGESWNGTFNAQPLVGDDYWFVVFYEDSKVFKGHFSLKR